VHQVDAWPAVHAPGKPLIDFRSDRSHGESTRGGARRQLQRLLVSSLVLGPEPFTTLRQAGVTIGFTGDFTPGPAESRQLASTAFRQARDGREHDASGWLRRDRRRWPLSQLPADAARRAVQRDLAGRRSGRTRTRDRRHAARDDRRYRRGPDGTGRGARRQDRYRRRSRLHRREPFGIQRAQVAAPHSWFVAFAESTATRPHRRRAGSRSPVVPRGGTGARGGSRWTFTAAKQLGYFE
jgi:hypothetical protein